MLNKNSGSLKNKVAIAFCVHHKPWLMMSTWITTLIQDYQDLDFYILCQIGDGNVVNKSSYQEYYQIAQKGGINPQLSPFDKRVKEISRINRENIYFIDFENDQTLDSGAWYKFLRTDHWRKYDYVFFIQEGSLFTQETVISASLDFAKQNDVHFLASGHEKRRVPKKLFLNLSTRGECPSEMDYFHDKQIKEALNIFSRDQKLAELFNSWGSDFNISTENHVPDIFDSFFIKIKRLIRALVNSKWSFKQFFESYAGESIYVNSVRRKLSQIVDYTEYKKVKFHKENGQGWFGCACNHMFSHQFLTKFTEKLARYNMYEVLELPFAGTPLEVIWGVLPEWLGYDRWFFNGIHRVRKNFVNYKREDDAPGMADYINRYYKGKIKVKAGGDFIRIKDIKNRDDRARLKQGLTADYFLGRA